MNQLTYRRARPSDTRSILNLIGFYSAKGLMLPRPFSQILERIRDFQVAVEEGAPAAAAVKGVVALHPVGEDLAEIRSLAVEESLVGKGIGKKLMAACVEDAREMRLNRVFALTYQTEFFSRLGFERVEKLTLPQKIWGDCVHCTKFSDCDEVAMLLNLDRP
ncbi:MAG TPA: N-acetyltransferase [bacterium]|nr:N-acetyltransferase [bacterium]